MDEKVKKYFELRKDINSFCNEVKITRHQLDTILYLGERKLGPIKKGCRVKELPMIDVGQSSISTETTKLWKRELVSKYILPDNQRTKRITLTEKGQELYQQAKEVLDDYL